ncbi:ABC transporter permease [Corynebacterium cystitidis]|uniref:Monosaccharide ABC transporter membrane protein, CUT2 family (TC 3.A.1.2.-) n=1 Tax=Corynebacterium cystitidis DSM 20524 TaxID=1121357 RepID=A0A1H9QJL2_9CORY|nr:ABC transporter permease [Corynebacterium cystitidis]WJY81754.1 Ribose transport system permease protein RbsC [Corynebacterium cystitidis DSM 20524]SER60618.1 monosaccharide ABC transporter membrane protein, CUT2 family (TC 3.A.1.2.-) [Corynebacterium cystitidis DSM 20524]SNV84004.1 ribose/xylose/arabinose/galactoside ABC-type transporter permease [Corynebacterium cystitidis]
MTTHTGTKQSPARSVGNWMMNNGALVGLIILVVALAVATPAFLSTDNLINIGVQAATVAIIAFGMTFVIVTGGIDLSVGAVAALGGMVTAYMWAEVGFPGWLTLVLGLATGLLAGCIAGLSIAYGKLPAFIATLAMMSITRGLTLVISEGSPAPSPEAVNWMGADLGFLPVPIIMMALAGFVCWFILSRTVLGRSMYAIGGNMEAARLSGLPVRRILISVYALSGIFAAWAGLVMTARLSSAQPNAGTGYELDAIAAVVIGGASLSGGRGGAWGTLVGALLLAVIRNGLNLLNVSSFWQQIVIGIVIAAAVGFDVIRNKTVSQ